MKPSKKSPAMEEFLETQFGRTTAIKNNVCTFCMESADNFKDLLSIKEYKISGLCQKCQDLIFGGK